jgi:hypothetical protein
MSDPLSGYFQQDEEDDPLAGYFSDSAGTPQAQSTKKTTFWEGFKTGAKDFISGVASPGALGPGGVQSSYTVKGAKPITREQIEKEKEQYRKNREEPTGVAGTLGQFAGGLTAGFPLYSAIGGPINMAAEALAARTASPLVRSLLGNTNAVLAKGTSPLNVAAKTALTRAPINSVTGVVTEAAVNPENVSTFDRLKNVAAFSAAGSVFDGVLNGYQFHSLGKRLIFEMGEQMRRGREGAKVGIQEFMSESGNLKQAQEYLDELLDQRFKTGFSVRNRSGGIAGMAGEAVPPAAPTSADIVEQRVAEAIRNDFQRTMNEVLLSESKKKDPLGSLFLRSKEEPDIIAKAYAKGINERMKQKFVEFRRTSGDLERYSVPGPRTNIDISKLNKEVNPLTADLAPTVGLRGQNRAAENINFISSPEGVTPPLGFTFEELENYHKILRTLPEAESLRNRLAVSRLETARNKALYGKMGDDGVFDPAALDPVDMEDWAREIMSMSQRLANGFDVAPPKRPYGSIPEKLDASGLDIPTSRTSAILAANSEPTLALTDPEVNNFLNRLIKKPVEGGKGTKSIDLLEQPIPENASLPAAEGYESSLSNVIGRLDYSPTTPTRWQKITEFFKNFRQETQDAKWAVAKLEKELGMYDPVTNPSSAYNAFELLAGSAQEADLSANIELRLPKFEDGKWTGESEVFSGMTPKQIIDKVGISRLQEFDALLLANRRLAKAITDPKNPQAKLDVTGAIKSGIDLADAQRIVDNAPEDLKQLAAETQRVAKWAREYLFRAGVKSQAALDAMEDGGFYASFGRVLDQTFKSNPLLQLLGSEKKFRSPSQNMYDNVLFTVERAKKNMAWNRVLDLYSTSPEAMKDWIEPWSKQGQDFAQKSVSEIAEQLRGQGMDISDTAVQDIVHFFLGGNFDSSNRTVNIFRDGRLMAFKVNPQLARMVDSMSSSEIGFFTAISSYLESTIRASTSLAYDLSGLGFIADTAEASMTVPGFKPILDSVRGLWHSSIKSPEWREKAAAGGGFGGRWLSAEQATRVQLGKDGTVRKVHIIKNPIEYLVTALRPLSEASRMGAYLRMKDSGASTLEAALMSRRIGGDWGQVGASLKPMAQATAFLNVGIQTATQASRALSRAAKDPDFRKQLLSTATAGITMPTVALYLAYENDEEIREARKAPDGYKYWFWRAPFDMDIPGIEVKKNDIMQMPVPGWLLGSIFSAPVSAGLDQMREADPEAFKRLSKTLAGQLGVNTIPVWFQTVTGLALNARNVSPFNTSSRVPIVPGSQAGLLPEAQVDERTSGLAQAVAPKIGMSPFKFDYLLERLAGAEMAKIVRVISQSEDSPELRKTDLPFAGRYFSRFPAGQTESIDMFYRDIEKYRQIKNSMDKFKKTAQVSDMEKLLEDSETLEALSMLPAYDAVYGFLNEELARISTITRMPGDILSSKEKRELIDDTRRRMLVRIQPLREMKKAVQ